MDMHPKDPEPPQATGISGPQSGNRLSRKFAEKTRHLPPNTIGALWILLAAFLFSIMVTLIKLVGQDFSVFQILVVRQAVMLVIVAPKILGGLPTSLATKRPGLQVTRIVFATTAMLLGFTAVIELPLADATAISFSKTFFLTIFAIWLLGEKVGIHRWGATIVGFLGVILMLRPDGEGIIDPFALFAIAGAACAGMVMIVVRILTRTDAPVTILTYQAFGVGLIMLVPAVLSWQAPTPFQWGILILIGIVSWAAQMANIQAFKAGEATAIASLDYTRLLYATIFGALVFSQWPRLETLAGAAVVIAASIYTVRREAKRGRELARAADGRGYNS
ncbi:DMT family transporter [Labrenzia sp. 011]|uniref:DMT family transporter n=1 Tax=Labrenzia sp. 011 TaxID=2171494 RepID=UPI000D511FCA|nr:DMT family transporter [Labrenzia sp. 011]PVB61721.1 EamA/RhaT family transporter [Labrenzia sp. 011]